MIITGIFHAAIKTNDLKATVDFYTKILGLREAARPDINHTHARAAVSAVIASIVGDPMVYVSGGAEHQGPSGGGPVAAIVHTG